MGSFTAWIRSKVKAHDRGVLLRDVLAEMSDSQRIEAVHEVLDWLSDDQVADIINDHADTLNNKGYDWGVFSTGEER